MIAAVPARIVVPFAMLAAAAASSSACRRGTESGGARPDGTPPKPPAIKADRTDLIFFWFDSEGAVRRGQRVDDVPLDARDRVLVQVVGPGQVGSGPWAFVTDLSRPRSDGTYPVEVMTRERYSEEVRSRYAAAQTPVAAPTGGPPPAGGSGSAAPLPAPEGRVAIYLTQGCPHCRRAKEWMTRHGVPFVEYDIEADARAARFVMERTGASSVPVFQVGSKILQGFSPDTLRKTVKDELGLDIL